MVRGQVDIGTGSARLTDDELPGDSSRMRMGSALSPGVAAWSGTTYFPITTRAWVATGTPTRPLRNYYSLYDRDLRV